MWERLLGTLLRQLIKDGDLTVHLNSGGTIKAGNGAAPHVTVRFHDDALPGKLIRNPELAMGKAYMDETLTIDGDDVRGLLTLVVRNFQGGNLPWTQTLARNLRIAKRKWDQWIPHSKAKQNAEHHYDISTAFYYLFLDEDKQYTCAYFKDPAFTLEEAQAAKKAHLAGKLLIKPGMKILDIGSGWGGLAITLAKDYGAQVVGVTLSDEQRKAATKRAEEAGVSHLVEFRLQDYRDVTEKFDRIVSVGMLEHVGQPQYPTYFRQIEQNLKEDGVALIHFIGRTGPPGNLSPWFQKYIFPSGYTPSLSEVVSVVEKTKLEAADIEVWRTHYDRTLYEWLIRFEDRLDEVRAMGYDERFIRMWRYYLIASELSLSDMPHVLYHVQLHKHQTTVPITRDYLYVDGAPEPHSSFPEGFVPKK
ncbi:SAM-dependent methyltransferase [Litoreibacter arenae]|uniref:Cyclopropane-fatty-acyl-phospholipid synthase n=1 Tax=Litoreibacter arenae DSM 19593 TaxID=1123360 RepID=S9QJA7_9RHOB|nr:cyclopropane-fatty-acyl-phospholipid synthase family protein [Litoreibacter arenae]EPX81526.1 Cyclopropane-fatty-acyl-phospholipid synthase [Litoreibacter arenae DSM 19593]